MKEETEFRIKSIVDDKRAIGIPRIKNCRIIFHFKNIP